MWHGHAASGVLAAEAVSPLVPHLAGPASLPLFVAVCALGSLVPDLDHRDGKLSHSLGPITWVLCRIVVHFSKVTFRLTRGPRDFKDSNGHRGITHTPIFAPVVAAGVWFAVPGALAWLVAGGLLLGQWTHQAGDACTNSGCPLLYPIKVNGKRWAHYGLPKGLRFETGGSFESGVTFVLGLLCVAVPALYAWLGWISASELIK
jgi:membrane-bound metal-dependent hydrolase YbcI (DUF457 family)